MKMSLSRSIFMRYAGALVAVACLGLPVAQGAVTSEPATRGAEPVNRRLTEDQYRQIIRDAFGPAIELGGRIEPDIREDNLFAVGASRVSVTASGLEEYDKIARNVAAQVVDKQRRGTLIPCKPGQENRADAACARKFFTEAGRLLLRRPLTLAEIETRVTIASEGAAAVKDFYAGLALGLVALLDSPEFLFRPETPEPDPKHPGVYRADGYSKASRLSFFLWNSAPDPALLDAAAKGELATEKGLAKQVDRMLHSPRVERGARAFFKDFLGLAEFETLAKDGALFPKYNPEVARDAQEQTLRTVADLLINNDGDYRDIFTSRKTFLTPMLASIYAVPLPATQSHWIPYEFPEGDPRTGILSQVSFVALHSHPGRSSPTLRGKALREIVLCQKVPPPPGNVNFSVVQDTKSAQYRTARLRLGAHATEAMCSGCHKLVDPLGLALENFDSAGSYRTSENGAPIDTSGELNGAKFADAAGLSKVIHDSPAASSCLVNRLYSYGMGRQVTKDEQAWLTYLQDQFAHDGYRFRALLRRIATSDAFYRIAPQMAQSNPTPANTKY